jgi:hypothetical protein
MLKPFVLSLALTGLGATAMGADAPSPEASTWRWQVSMILDAQRENPRAAATADSLAFDQRYERYSATGLPETPAKAPKK